MAYSKLFKSANATTTTTTTTTTSSTTDTTTTSHTDTTNTKTTTSAATTATTTTFSNYILYFGVPHIQRKMLELFVYTTKCTYCPADLSTLTTLIHF